MKALTVISRLYWSTAVLAVFAFGLPAHASDGFVIRADEFGRPVGYTTFGKGNWRASMDGAFEPATIFSVTQIDPTLRAGECSLLIADNMFSGEVNIGVLVNPRRGTRSRAAGLVFRFLDPRHYYVFRVDLLRNDVRLFRMDGDTLIQLAEADVTRYAHDFPFGPGYKFLGVKARRERIVCWYGGRKLIDVKDSRYGNGRLGFWTEGDSISSFAPVGWGDDL